MTNRLRLYSGLILFIFVTGHLLNISLGLVSVDAMVAGTTILLNPWHSIIGSTLYMGAFFTHTSVAIWSLWQRRTLRMTLREGIQACLGLSAPFLLAAHVIETRVIGAAASFEPSYYTILTELWVMAPWRGVVQAGAVLVVWIHGCIGLHMWLRLFPAYVRLQYFATAAAVLIPAFALGGYIAAGNHILERAQQDGWARNIFEAAQIEAWIRTSINVWEFRFHIGFAAFLIALLMGRYIRAHRRARHKKMRLNYMPGNKAAELLSGATLLESIQAAGIHHSSVCGGRGRCSTCRVRIGNGLNDLPPASEQELKILSRITQSPAVRLACQLRPTKDLDVIALVEPGTRSNQVKNHREYQPGREMDLVFLVVDLRGSARLSEERLPFDVAYILDRFFAELSIALQESNGHYAQFNGDGLLAIYGLTSGPIEGCREALIDAEAMLARIDLLNERLKGELTGTMKIGIGIHAGEAIVGTMGPPASPIVSALGDNVNIAARLESQTKEFNVPLVISSIVAKRGGLELSRMRRHSVQVKGRNQEVDVYPINDVSCLPVRSARKDA